MCDHQVRCRVSIQHNIMASFGKFAVANFSPHQSEIMVITRHQKSPFHAYVSLVEGGKSKKE